MISQTTLLGNFPPVLKASIIPSTNSFVGLYRALLSDGMVGSGKLYEEESRSHAPDDIADVHFEDADSVSPIEIACCQRVLTGWVTSRRG